MKLKLENMEVKYRKVKTNKKVGMAHVWKDTNQQYCECPTCGYQENLRVVRFDSTLAKTLKWMVEEAERTGSDIVGVTKRVNPDVPDWIVADRAYSKLKYWKYVKPAGQGKYQLGYRPEVFRRYFESGEKKTLAYVLVANDVQFKPGVPVPAISFAEAMATDPDVWVEQMIDNLSL